MLSFVVPAFNEEKHIGLTIVFIKDECNRAEVIYEIIVVDNGSTDNTVEIARNEGARVVFESQKGVVFARQRGYLEAKYPFICNIDADTLIPEGWIDIAMDPFKVFSDTWDTDIVATTGPPVYYNVSKSITILTRVYYWLATLSSNTFGSFLQGGNCIIRKDALQKINGYDTSFAFYGEDTMTAKRLSKVGKVKFLSEMWAYTSPRRFEGQGLINTAWMYVINYFSVIFFSKSTTKKYVDYR